MFREIMSRNKFINTFGDIFNLMTRSLNYNKKLRNWGKVSCLIVIETILFPCQRDNWWTIFPILGASFYSICFRSMKILDNLQCRHLIDSSTFSRNWQYWLYTGWHWLACCDENDDFLFQYQAKRGNKNLFSVSGFWERLGTTKLHRHNINIGTVSI